MARMAPRSKGSSSRSAAPSPPAAGPVVDAEWSEVPAPAGAASAGSTGARRPIQATAPVVVRRRSAMPAAATAAAACAVCRAPVARSSVVKMGPFEIPLCARHAQRANQAAWLARLLFG